jgi:3-oxoacyl-[acyl-carrier-protein] synthase II
LSNSAAAKTRVVVTGLGAVTPLGNDVASTWEGLLAGRSGIRFITRFDASGFDGAIAGEVRDFKPETYMPAKRARTMDPSSQFGVAAALEALRDAGLDAQTPLGPRAGVIFGSSLGGPTLLEAQTAYQRKHGTRRLKPFTLTGLLPDSASGQIAILTGATGPNMAVLAASATGAGSVGEAAEIIRRGDADIMIAGACEAPLTPVIYGAFAAMRNFAKPEGDPTTACRPFDARRTGFVLAEGAGALVLESLENARARGATPYAEVGGYGSANDAFHMIAEEPAGRGLVAAIAIALRKSGLSPQSIGYVNAHGTASRMNDRIETEALKRAFGSHACHLAISSTKSMTGHLMAGAGALEAVISVLALRHGIMPPTINHRDPDPDCDLDYIPNQARPAPGLDAVLSNSTGLGGHNVALVFHTLRP